MVYYSSTVLLQSLDTSAGEHYYPRITTQGYHAPSSQCLGTDMVYYSSTVLLQSLDTWIPLLVNITTRGLLPKGIMHPVVSV
jgi:hypothetical protein